MYFRPRSSDIAKAVDNAIGLAGRKQLHTDFPLQHVTIVHNIQIHREASSILVL